MAQRGDLPLGGDRLIDTGALRAMVVEQIAVAVPGLEVVRLGELVATAAPSSWSLAALHRYLRTRPDALTSGDGQAPPVICRLIRLLVDAGADARLPRCARCGRGARSLPVTAAEGRICHSCWKAAHTERCTGCGRRRPVNARTPEGPLCQRCRSYDPVLKHPCTGCGNNVRLVFRLTDGGGLCSRCYLKQRPVKTCHACGALAPVEARTPAGPVCPGCYQRPAGRCDVCGDKGPLWVRRRAGRAAVCRRCYRSRRLYCTTCGSLAGIQPCADRGNQPTCPSCWPLPPGTCARCRRTRRIATHWPLGGVCGSCYKHIRAHPAPCTRCGDFMPLIGKDADGAGLCGPCSGDPRTYTCPRCQTPDFFLTTNRCPRCQLTDRLAELLAPGGTITEQLSPFIAAVTATTNPIATLDWLAPGHPAANLLTHLVTSGQPITHAALDTLPPSLALHRLRQTLTHTGVLPPRSDLLDRLQPWLEALLTDQPPDRALPLRAYAQWSVLHRARQRSHSRGFTPGSASWARTRIRAALALLTWIEDQNLSLASLTQADLDRFIIARPSAASDARQFLHFARRRRLAGELSIPKRRPRHPAGPITDDERWHHLRRCLHDGTLPIRIRAAGALVLLYGIPLSRVSTLRHENLHTDPAGHTHLQLGLCRLRVVPALAALLDLQRDRATSVAPLYTTAPTPPTWLFPGGLPGAPSRYLLGRDLRRHGIPHLTRARSAALISLAAELPAAVLASLLDINVNTAIGWAHYAQTDWAAYLATRTRAHRTDGASTP